MGAKRHHPCVMSEAGLEAVLKRDRAILVAALAALCIIAWAYIAWLAATMTMPTHLAGMDMSGMDMSKMDMSTMLGPSSAAWSLTEVFLIFAMWAIMMIGMMTPSVAPMVLIYAAVGRKARASGKPFASAVWFLSGYLSVWMLFSILAAAAQWLLACLALLSPMMAVTSMMIAGLVLIVAGIYQWTPLKDACLGHCRAPLGFLMAHGGFRPDWPGAWGLGARHGLYCLGCCWALMALLFVGGVMSLLWIAGLAILVLLEKIVPAGRMVARLAGVLMVAGGSFLVVRALHP
jgi:predicted metal-binding membrane protein